MTDRLCAREGCGNSLAPSARKDAKYCGKSCRVMATRARKKAPAVEPASAPAPVVEVRLPVPADLPAALTRLPRWVRRAENKTPLQSSGEVAKSTDPETWSTYAEAAESSAGAGLGFVLSGDGVGVIDLDHCFVDGKLTPAAEKFLADVPDTYVEISPSGDGLHIWGKGIYVTSRKSRRDDLAGEVIGSKKYCTVTGRRFRGSPLRLANISRAAGALIN